LHDERDAELMVRQGMELLGLDEDQLRVLRKGADEKALLAWLVRRNSVVPNAWIAERLGMGRPDCLSRYPARIEKSQEPHLVALKEKLNQITRLRD
jgi:hypothetical protein